jgi:hypothetical protein
MATPRQRTTSATPLSGMKPALKAPLRSLVLLLLPSLGQLRSHVLLLLPSLGQLRHVLLLRPKLTVTDAQNRNRRQEFYDGFDCH